MKLSELPIVEEVFESGANDRVFDSLLLIGPVLIAGIAIVGRSTVTTGIAIAYVLFFVAYVGYRGISN
ncbi:hypothetical protein [Natrinema pallidum]|uniref:Uncharacterized protein n=2 Tax=Natrinema pallidum TaxID=69527 RepID=L9YZX5_9EURY|nr:hypothetical protein [Natrinema pallidum]ELY79815.1 hypothetical protein C487_05509 [Natrinema pallidum DSM 3751]QCW02310.1 hypothetical protein FGF80_03270 [Natrinema pallidum]